MLPVDWDVRALGNLCNLKSGQGITAKNIGDSGFYPCFGGNGLRGYTKSYTHEGIFALIGRQGALCGNVQYVTGKFFASEHALVATPSKGVNTKWLAIYLERMNLNQYSESSAQPGLSAEKLRILQLITPTEEEQTAIANALSDVDALITSLEKLITKKRAIKTAAMQQLLTGKKRLPGFTGEWCLVSMKNDAILKARIGWQALTTNEYLEHGHYYLVTGTDFKGGKVNWATCHYVDEWRYSQDRNIQLSNGDVLLTKDGTIGKVGCVDNLTMPATLNSGVFVIRPVNEAFSPLFLFYVLSSRIFDDFLNRITAGSTITHLYQKDFVTFEFFAPSLEEQKEIAASISSMDDEIGMLEQRLTKTQQLKQGMMQELLTGKTRLV